MAGSSPRPSWSRSAPIAAALLLALGCRPDRGVGEEPATTPATEPGASTAIAEAPAAPEPELPECDGQPCPPPRECIQYFGIAGPSGPSFHACELRCDRGGGDSCPDGTRCVTIADGPGDVCR